MVDFSFWIKVFKNPWMKKIWKNRFSCLIPQKSRLEKCRLKVKLFFFKYWFFWKSWTEKYQKTSIFSHYGDFERFWYFLVHNFHKNQYFQKMISLSIDISQVGSFEVSMIKIYKQILTLATILILARAKYRLSKDAEVLAETPLDGGSENAWFLQISVCRYIGTMGIFSVSCECPWTLSTSSGQFQGGFSWVLLHIPFSFWKTSHFSCTKDVLYTFGIFVEHEMQLFFCFPWAQLPSW